MPSATHRSPESNQKWFIGAPRSTFSRSVEEIAPQDDAMAQAWTIIEVAFDDVAAHPVTVKEGKFCITGEPNYSRFELVAILTTVRASGLMHGEGWRDVWAKLMDILIYKKLATMQG
ncbi:hypothetical protein ACEPAH_8060 [Sanghuangporus vaninii]